MHGHKIRVRFAKKGEMRFISHLDLQRLFGRAMRRAGLSLFLSSGFSPHPKISFKRALKLGLESEEEEVSIVLKEYAEPGLIKEKLQQQLPAGIEIGEAICISGKGN